MKQINKKCNDLYEQVKNISKCALDENISYGQMQKIQEKESKLWKKYKFFKNLNAAIEKNKNK